MRRIILLALGLVIFWNASSEAQKCRPANGSYSLDMADLPVCRESSAQSVRAPSLEYAPFVTFNSYMVDNARNPDLSSEIPNYEQAFQDLPNQIMRLPANAKPETESKDDKQSTKPKP